MIVPRAAEQFAASRGQCGSFGHDRVRTWPFGCAVELSGPAAIRLSPQPSTSNAARSGRARATPRGYGAVVTLAQYLLGLLLLGTAAGACGAAAWLVVRRRLAGLPSYARGAAFGVLWAAALLVATLVPAAAGVLGRARGPVRGVLVLALVRKV